MNLIGILNGDRMASTVMDFLIPMFRMITHFIAIGRNSLNSL